MAIFLVQKEEEVNFNRFGGLFFELFQGAEHLHPSSRIVSERPGTYLQKPMADEAFIFEVHVTSIFLFFSLLRFPTDSSVD